MDKTAFQIINDYKKSYLFWILTLIIILAHQIIFQDFFPNKNLLLGHDYFYTIPNLIFGKVWFNNNFLSIPWFTPSFCCGIPFFGDPQSMYYSFQQIIFLFFSPILSLKIIFLFFSLIGFLGTFILLNKSFKKNIYISLIAASLFLFNGFLNYRAVVGHVTFLSFAFIPIYCYLIIKSFENKENKSRSIFYLLVSSIVFANFFHSGSAVIMIHIILSIIFILFIYIYLNEKLKIIYSLILSFLIGILIASSKIHASLSFLSNFPREYPPLVFENYYQLAITAFKSLFLYPIDISTFNSIIINKVITKVGNHEIEYGVSIVPLIVLILFLTNLKKIKLNKLNVVKITSIFFILIISLFIISLNFLDNSLGNFIQKLPIIKSSWVNYRLIAIYIIPIIIMSSILIEKLNFNKRNIKIFTIACLTIILLQNFFYKKDFYINQKFDPKNFEIFHKDKEKIKTLKIKNMVLVLGKNRENINISQRNSFFIDELSPILCHQAIFGYSLQSLPRKNLWFSKKNKISDNLFYYTGDPKLVKEDNLNFFNPSCFIFPKENNCIPGDVFKKNQVKELENFLNYKNFKFKMSKLQKIFNYISILSFLTTFCFIIYYIFRKYTSKI